MKPLAPALLALWLAACASDRSLTDTLAGNRVKGDAASVVVSRADSVPDALPLAIGHCAHFHLSAQYAGRAGDQFRFRCVAR